MNYDQNLRNLRNQICSDWTRDDTKFIQIDSSLWRMCQKTLGIREFWLITTPGGQNHSPGNLVDRTSS